MAQCDLARGTDCDVEKKMIGFDFKVFSLYIPYTYLVTVLFFTNISLVCAKRTIVSLVFFFY